MCEGVVSRRDLQLPGVVSSPWVKIEKENVNQVNSREREREKGRERSNLPLKVSNFIFWRTQNIHISHCFKLGTCSAGLWLSWRASPRERQALKKKGLNKIKPQSYRAMCPDLLACPKIIGSLTSQPGLVPLSKTNRTIGRGLAHSPNIPIILWIQCCEESVLWYWENVKWTLGLILWSRRTQTVGRDTGYDKGRWHWETRHGKERGTRAY